jgi:YHS domain-containing protein
MLRSLFISFILISFLSAFTSAQERPEVEKKCDSRVTNSKNCDTTKECFKQIVNVKETTETVSKSPWNKVCPVRGESVDPEAPTVEYNGKVYGFCCPGCDMKFAKNPEKYAKNLSEDGKKFIGKK